jgi:hypothetical protein
MDVRGRSGENLLGENAWSMWNNERRVRPRDDLLLHEAQGLSNGGGTLPRQGLSDF